MGIRIKMEHENKRNRGGVIQNEAVYNFRRITYPKYNICRLFSQSLLNYS